MFKKQEISMSVIKTARKFLANTPVQKWPITTTIYRKVFHYGYRAKEISVDFRGVQLTIPSKDVTIVPGLVGGFYEKIELDVYEQLAKVSKVIIDVGGSIGDYTSVGALRLPEKGKIVVFEPVEENVGYIKKNLAQNNLTHKAVVEHSAVGEFNGKIQIHTVEGSVGTHSASKVSAAGISSTSVVVPMTSIDSYVKKHKLVDVDILKIDVEGYDGFVLKGATKLMRSQKPTIFIEFVADNLINCDFDPNEFFEILLSFYSQVYLVDEPKGILKRCDRSDLEYLASHSMNANLILTNNPKHETIINKKLKS